MASDADVGDEPPPCGGGSPGMDGRSVSVPESVRSSGTDPPDTPAMGSFTEGVSSWWRRSMMNITSRQRRSSPQDLSGTSILPHESRTFGRDVTAHTVTSNQDGSDTKLLVTGVFVSPESDRQQQQLPLSPRRGEIQMDLHISTWTQSQSRTRIPLEMAPLDCPRFHRKSTLFKIHRHLCHYRNHIH